MKPVLALAILMLATPADARCFSVWRYNYPQRCGGSHHVVGLVTHASLEAPLPAPRPGDADIPLPDMAAVWDGQADAATRDRLIAIIKLREQLNR